MSVFLIEWQVLKALLSFNFVWLREHDKSNDLRPIRAAYSLIVMSHWTKREPHEYFFLFFLFLMYYGFNHRNLNSFITSFKNAKEFWTSGILTPVWLVGAATSKKTLTAGAISGIVIGGLFVILAVGAYAYLQKRRADRLKKREDPFGTVS